MLLAARALGLGKTLTTRNTIYGKEVDAIFGLPPGVVVFLMKTWSDEEPINIGIGADVTITHLAKLIAEVVGFTGKFVFDAAKPDGTPHKLLDVTKLTALGWTPRIDLAAGIRQT
jgi:nucleoside-diphosphate-sugar epimerase